MAAAALMLAVVAAASDPTPPAGVKADSPPNPVEIFAAGGPRALKLIVDGFSQTFPLNLRVVASSMPGRFFAGVHADVLDRLGPDGHYLKMGCGAKLTPCDAGRDALEERLMMVSLIQALPRELPDEELFDPQSFEVRAPGRQLVAQTRRRHPTLMAALAAVVARHFGRR